ncbi:MAG TPA: XdhC family protein, partial [Blastocatellia bacterium]|nr:XdhC family protein [Blastocatellia bacterium]
FLGRERIRTWNIPGADGDLYKVVVDILRPRVGMHVFGAGHVGQAVSMIGAMLGYSVRVYDDRPDLLLRERFPDSHIELIGCNFEMLGDVLGELKGSIIVIVTRGHQYDEVCLKQVMDSQAAYIGMIGSKRRVLSIFKKLREDGINEREFGKVHAPIGLRIGAITPQEIAVSILAEVIQELNGAN